MPGFMPVSHASLKFTVKKARKAGTSGAKMQFALLSGHDD
jgi:hypothetical protein